MTELSAQAQVVMDAYFSALHKTPNQSVAAALRAAVDQVVPRDGSRRANEIRSEFLAIVTELENHDHCRRTGKHQ